MPTVTNKTHRPLSVPLPGGKTLHLGPSQTGDITAKAASDPRLKKLAEAGEIEILADGRHGASGAGRGRQGHAASGFGAGSGIRRSGNR